MNAQKALSCVRSLAPEALAAAWDNSRVQISGTRGEVKKLAVTLDPLPAIMAEALAWGADLVVTHHPLYLKPQAPTQDGQYLSVLRQFMTAGAWLYTAHTSLDCRPDGPAFWLGRALKLQDCASIEPVQAFPAREVFFQAPARITEREARPLSETPGVIAVSQSNSGEVRIICEERAWDDISERLKAIFGQLPEFLVRRLEAPVEQVGFGQLGQLPKALACEDFARLLEKAPKRQCIFELIYFARPDSMVFDEGVYERRKAMGAKLATEAPVDADFVMPFPDSGNYAAVGYSQASGLPLELAMIRNHYVGRTFIQPSQDMRNFSVRVKLNPVRSMIQGKRILIVEDSIVRGTTIRTRVKKLREMGAREIHMRVSCPAIRFPCFYGIDFSSKGELIAATTPVNDIARFIGLDSLHYLSIPGLLDSVVEKDAHCLACFDGNYPIAPCAHQGKMCLEAESKVVG